MSQTSVQKVLDGSVGAAGMLLAFFTPFLRAQRDHWGLSPELAERALPGDELAGPHAYTWTHGLEIDAPAKVVWPWVVQVGQEQAGFYSYEFLENLMGCGIHNADAIHSEWQERKLGDVLKLHPQMPMDVVQVQPGHFFVAASAIAPPAGASDAPSQPVRVSWLFLVEAIDALRCRFISRFRLDVPADAPAGFGPWLMEPVGFVMDRRMLLGVRERAQRQTHSPSIQQVGPLTLEGKVVLLTGATRGIGRATADWLVRAGARVGLLCRDEAAAQRVRTDLNALAGSDAAFVVPIDLASMDSVTAAAQTIASMCPRIDVLIHNAGEYRLDRTLTHDGFERMLAVGYLGPWLLTAGLRQRLLDSAPARIVVTAGIYHRRGDLDLGDMHFARRAWDPMAANNQMQLARASFAFELARQLKHDGVTVNAVHPGAVRTGAQDSLSGWQRVLLDTVGRFVLVDPAEGALPNLRLAGERALTGITGRYFSGLDSAEPSPEARDLTRGDALWQWTLQTLARWLP